MSKMRKITAFMPADLLAEAQACTGEGITETLKRGLEELAKVKAYSDALALRGKVFIDFDKDASREDRDLD